MVAPKNALGLVFRPIIFGYTVFVFFLIILNIHYELCKIAVSWVGVCVLTHPLPNGIKNLMN
jgi:hypothetical protein